MKINQVLKFSRQKLREQGIKSFLVDSRVLLSYHLKVSKENLILNSESKLTNNQLKGFFKLVNRRCKKEPVSHIIGRREFWELDFIVSKDVLDPRPDSETLIEHILEVFPNRSRKLKILELGVGSGCLILTCLEKFKNSFGVGIDISNKAIKVAKKNSKSLDLNERVKFIKSDWFESVEDKFDLIISNPPYISSWEIKKLPKEVKFYEPLVALDGGSDGLNCYKLIAKGAPKFVAENGFIVVEIGKGQYSDVRKIFENESFEFISKKKDLSGTTRSLCFGNSPNFHQKNVSKKIC